MGFYNINYSHQQGDQGYYGLCDGQLIVQQGSCELSKIITIEASSSNKFSFWYYMYGRQIGTLKLKKDNKVIWEKDGRQGAEWLLAEVELPVGTYNVRNILNCQN